jgi:hypothetical protein
MFFVADLPQIFGRGLSFFIGQLFPFCRRVSWFFFVLLLVFSLSEIRSAPPLVIPYTPDYGGDYDLFGGENYLTSDDGLMLESLTATHGMSMLKKTQVAMERLRSLTDPLRLAKLRAPVDMQRELYLTLYWLAEADMAEADVEQVLQEISRRGRDHATPADTTMAEVLLYNFHLARHLGILGFPGLAKLSQALPAVIPENDGNDQNRLAFAVSILPPERFPEIAHQLFNYEIFDGALPKAHTPILAHSQIEFAQKLISRGLLPADALKR